MLCTYDVGTFSNLIVPTVRYQVRSWWLYTAILGDVVGMSRSQPCVWAMTVFFDIRVKTYEAVHIADVLSFRLLPLCRWTWNDSRCKKWRNFGVGAYCHINKYSQWRTRKLKSNLCGFAWNYYWVNGMILGEMMSSMYMKYIKIVNGISVILFMEGRLMHRNAGFMRAVKAFAFD